MIDQTVISTGKWTSTAGRRSGTHVDPGAAEALSPSRPAAVPVKAFLTFLFVLIVLCALTCAYIWQMSQIAVIKLETADLEKKVTRLEQENVSLMLQVARLDSPAAVEEQALALGMAPAKQVVHVAVAPAGVVPTTATQETTERESSALAALWQRLFSPLAN